MAAVQPIPATAKFKNLIGEKFGRWTVLEFSGREGTAYFWQCQCQCESKTIRFVDGKGLKNGTSKSCGCLRIETITKHGMGSNGLPGNRRGRTPEYWIWISMKERCYNEKYKGYERYGGRGISVCQRWRYSFEAFLADMGMRPSSKYSIDREKNNGHYSCGKCEGCQQNGWTFNCRWATAKEQARNRSNSRLVTVDGETKTIAEWVEISGIGHTTINNRLKKGWLPKDAVFVPEGTRKKRGAKRFLTIDGETHIMAEWSRIFGVSSELIAFRLKRGQSPKEAVFTPVHHI